MIDFGNFYSLIAKNHLSHWLETLPAQIAALEAEQKQIQEALADGSLFSSDNAKAVAMHQREAQIDEALMEALERWTQLSE